MDQISIVNITPIQKTFIDRLDFAIDSGFNYTQANRSGEFNVSTSAKYRVEKYSAQADYSTLFKGQRDAETTRRNQLGLNFTRYLQNRWFVSTLANFLQSDELALDLRSVFGGGAGKNLVQTNRLVFSLLGGAVINREQFVDEDIQTSAEGLSGIQFQTFKFDKPEMDISSTFLVIPSFSNWGRVRLDLDTKVRIEIIKDLFWQVSLFDNYDSRPPEGNEKNDFGINTGVGWSF
jgi:putative salt-induced outer membrane protein YdiY